MKQIFVASCSSMFVHLDFSLYFFVCFLLHLDFEFHFLLLFFSFLFHLDVVFILCCIYMFISSTMFILLSPIFWLSFFLTFYVHAVKNVHPFIWLMRCHSSPIVMIVIIIIITILIWKILATVHKWVCVKTYDYQCSWVVHTYKSQRF